MSIALSNIQQELLKFFSTNIPEEQLLEIKKLLSDYFAEKAGHEIARLWEVNDWNNNTMKQWTNEHNRHKKSSLTPTYSSRYGETNPLTDGFYIKKKWHLQIVY